MRTRRAPLLLIFEFFHSRAVISLHCAIVSDQGAPLASRSIQLCKSGASRRPRILRRQRREEHRHRAARFDFHLQSPRCYANHPGALFISSRVDRYGSDANVPDPNPMLNPKVFIMHSSFASQLKVKQSLLSFYSSHWESLRRVI